MWTFLNDTFFPTICVAAFLPTLAPIYYLTLYFVLMWYCYWVRLPLILYLVWGFLDRSPYRGKWPRLCDWTRRRMIWKWMGRYFPVSIVKTAELDASRNYLFCCHPHGVISFGTIVCTATEGSNFSTFFPGIRIHTGTLDIVFRIPFYRDIVLLLGFCPADRTTCVNVLTSDPGHSLALVVGGAQEALDAAPQTMILTLKNRKGFVRIALTCGSPIVPVFCFGENDVFDVIHFTKGSLGRWLQDKFQRITSFSLPIFRGRSELGFVMPHRRPITLVFGAPIEVSKVANPTEELVDQFHQQYIQALTDLYNKYRSVVPGGPGESVPLVIR